MCNRLRNVVIALAIAVAGAALAAQNITVPNTFVNGTAADAPQVNANFAALAANALNRNAGVFGGTATPDGDNTRDLGTTALRFANVFAYNGDFKGTATVAGATTLKGAVALGDATADAITVPGTIGSSLLFTDATFDIGATGATRPRDYFGSRDITAGRDLYVTAGNIVGRAEFNAGNSSTAIAINFTTNGPIQKVTRTGSCTFTLTAPPSPTTVVLKMVHEASATVYTVAFSPSVKFPNGTAPTWTNTSGAIDILTLYWDGTAWFGVQQAAFS